MFLKIIRNDLKKKKSMNIILFIFIVFTSFLFASSGNVFYTAATALSSYTEKAKLTDYYAFTLRSEQQEKDIKKWADNCKEVKEADVQNGIYLEDSQIYLPSGKTIDDGVFTMMQKVSKKNNIPFDETSQEAIELKSGEMAISPEVQAKGNLKIGDKLTFKVDERKYTYEIKHIVKDALVGAKIMGCRRYFVSDGDYDKMVAENKDCLKVSVWSFTKTADADMNELSTSFDNEGFNTVVNFGTSMIRTAYIMDLLLVAVMVIVSIFLLVIAFMILRFTIVFTLQGDFRQIGIMKAIGMKYRNIKWLYLAKYAFLAIIGGAIGYVISIPASKSMMGLVAGNIMIEEKPEALLVALAGAIAEVLLILLFCGICTRRIRKYSAVAAIRGGETGKSFRRHRHMSLHRRKRGGVPSFLAVNDVISRFTRYLVLFITFVLGTILLIFPSNLVDTIGSDTMLQLAGESEYDFSLGVPETLKFLEKGSKTELDKLVSHIEDEANLGGVKVNLRCETYYSAKAYAKDPAKTVTLQTKRAYDYDLSKNNNFMEGVAPKYANEIAITKMAADRMGVKVGDSIYVKANNRKDKFVVTGFYQSMNNLGMAAFWSDKYELAPNNFSGISILGTFKDTNLTDEQKDAEIKKLEDIYTGYRLRTRKEVMNDSMGGFTEQMQPMALAILVIVLGINFLITILTTRILLSRETGEIGMMKSMGFKNRSLQKQQIIRILIVLILGIAVGTLLSTFVGNSLAGIVFNMIGISSVQLNVDIFRNFCVYPLMIIAVTVIAVLLSTSGVRKVKVWECNDGE